MHKFLMLFVDGVGIGRESETNPFFKYHFKTFELFNNKIPVIDEPVICGDRRYIFPVDAVLGMKGLPQSGTGQTSIFCGVNAQAIFGDHFGPFPPTPLLEVIEKENIFRTLKEKGKSVFFVNAYPKVFFDYIKSGKKRLSVTTLSCRYAGMRLNKASDVHRGNALSAEITGEKWIKNLNYHLKLITPEKAAERLLRITAKHDFTVFEYFLTDHIGHLRHPEEHEKILMEFDRFLHTLIEKLDYENTTLLVCSDHGNLEDMSIKTHTLNPAIGISAGKYAEQLYNEIKDITQIKNAIIKTL